jgi:hypothetical protein
MGSLPPTGHSPHRIGRLPASSALVCVWFFGCGTPADPVPHPAGRAAPQAVAPTLKEQITAVRSGATTRIVAATPPTAAEWEAIGQLTGLRELILEAGRAGDAEARRLAGLPAIERLVLRYSPLTDDGFAALATATSLRDLNVPQAACTAAGLQPLTALPRLRNLRLGGPGLAGAGVCEAIVELPALRSLHLIDVPIGDAGLDVLARKPDLWNLYLDGAGVSDDAWRRYFAMCPRVHVHVDQAHHDRDPARHDH